jgi:glycosyltransferase involved in cell wall biosynthesis
MWQFTFAASVEPPVNSPAESGMTNPRQAKVAFVAWQDHRRTREICAALTIERHALTTRARGVRRYLTLIPRTLCLFSRKRSYTVVVQNPSLVLSILTVLARPLFSLRTIMDAHNEAIDPFLNPHPLVGRVSRWLQRRFDYVIVTNRFLARTVVRNGGRPIVLPDRIPEPLADQEAPIHMRGRCNIVVISTFVKDEPLGEVLAAARELDADYHFYVTGDHRDLEPGLAAAAPSNVSFTGFLSEPQYWSALRHADLIVDLSLIDNCLVCGAYEALAVGTPLVLSRNAAAIELFSEVARFADNSSTSIANAIREVRTHAADLRARAPQVREKLRADWQVNAQVLQQHLHPEIP